MFETNDSYEIPVPAGLGGNGARLWQYVESGLALPWFHVTFRRDTRQRTLFTGHVDIVNEIERHPACAVIVVMLVSPPWLNGSNQWRMEELDEISIGSRRDDSEVTIYRVVARPEAYTDPPEVNVTDRAMRVSQLYRRARK